MFMNPIKCLPVVRLTPAERKHQDVQEVPSMLFNQKQHYLKHFLSICIKHKLDKRLTEVINHSSFKPDGTGQRPVLLQRLEYCSHQHTINQNIQHR